MKMTTLVVALMLVAGNALAEEGKKKTGHDKEHSHVTTDKVDHDHEEAHHKAHDHKAHHPDHKDEQQPKKK